MRAIVTGAAKGIGRAVAELFADKGWSLVLMDVDSEGLVEAAKNCSKARNVEICCGSVAKSHDCAKAAQIARESFGGLDVLSHNAGIQRYGTAGETEESLWDEVMDVNLKSGYLLARATIEMLKESSGSVVFMASVQGLASQNSVAAYSTAKHGLIGLTRSMAVDYAKYGVRVNAVAPGAVDTPMLRTSLAQAVTDDREALERSVDQMHPLGRRAKAEEVAEAVYFLATKKSSFITGEVLKVDGGMRAQLGASMR